MSAAEIAREESSVCFDYPNCDRPHAGGAGGVLVHPWPGARISGCDGPLIPDDAQPLVRDADGKWRPASGGPR